VYPFFKEPFAASKHTGRDRLDDFARFGDTYLGVRTLLIGDGVLRFSGDVGRFFGDGARSAISCRSLNTLRSAINPLIGSCLAWQTSNLLANSRARLLVLELW
jgi:hypothetical protein